jgi:sec-independent protein translocase protein TatA
MAGHLQVVAFLQSMGTGEWMIILIIGLLVFGRRLPDVARSLGRSVNEFKKGMREFQDSAEGVASDVSKAANEAISETDVHASQATYEGSPGSYESQTTSEPASEAPKVASSTEHDPYQSKPADSSDSGSKEPPSPGPYEPMA